MRTFETLFDSNDCNIELQHIHDCNYNFILIQFLKLILTFVGNSTNFLLFDRKLFIDFRIVILLSFKYDIIKKLSMSKTTRKHTNLYFLISIFV